MRTILKLFLAVSLLTSAAVSTASCPSITTAISEIGATTLTATTSTTAPFHYSGTSTFDSSTVDYYSNAQPTTVTPTQQLKRLAPALKTGIPLSVESGSTSVACAYLGSATGTAPNFIPQFDAWNQVIVITSSGSSPPPPPPPPSEQVAVSIKITGDLATAGAQSVPVKLIGATIYGPVTIAADGNTNAFATINAGTYTAAPTYVVAGDNEYYLKSSGSFLVDSTHSTINLEYDKVSVGSGTVTFNVYNDRTLTGAAASGTQTVTFTSATGQATVETFTLTNGTASQNYVLPNGTYTVTLKAPTGYNPVVQSTMLVLTDTPITVNADYKYTGTYVYLSQANYELLLSSKDQTINLGQGTVTAHCHYTPLSTPPYYQTVSCDQPGDFEFPTTVRTIGSTQVVESDLWAMSTAMASLIERMELEYGHHSFVGAPGYTFPNQFPNYHNDTPLYPASSIAVMNTSGITTLGDYLYLNISPNYFLSRCIQESTQFCRNGIPYAGGIFAIDSYPTTLSNAVSFGYSLPFSFTTEDFNVKDPGGPFNTASNPDMSNFVGSVISSAFFDTTSYTPQWQVDNAENLLSTVQASTTLPDVLEYFSSLMYNQGPLALGGPGATYQLFFKLGDPATLLRCATTDYASQNSDVRFDGTCFWPQGSAATQYGALYPFQLPDINHNVLEVANTVGGHFYKNSALTWNDISAYLDLIGPTYYGFYDAYDIAQAKIAGQAAFTTLAGSGSTIDFQTQFPTVLNAIMQTLPVYLSEACIPGAADC